MPEKEPLPLNPTAQAEIEAILAGALLPDPATEYIDPPSTFQPVNDFSKEPLHSPAREQLRTCYQRIMGVLPLLGFSENNLKYGTVHSIAVDLIGFPGNFSVSIIDKRDPAISYIQISKAIVIRRNFFDPQRKKWDHTTMNLSNFGTGYIEKRQGYNMSSGIITPNRVTNPQFALEEITRFTQQFCAAAENPEYSVEGIRLKLQETKQRLTDFFALNNITPQMDKKIFHYEPCRALEELMRLTGVKGLQDEARDYEIEVGHPYVAYFQGTGAKRWDIRFDIDVDHDYQRVRGLDRYTEKIQAHGTGLIFSYTEYSDTNPPVVTTYKLWDNGNAESPGGEFEEFHGAAAGRSLYVYNPVYNPHLLLIQFAKLEHAITGGAIPSDIEPPKPPSLMERLKGRLKH